MKLVEISQELLKASKCLDCVTPLLNQISTVSLSDLNSFLDTDEKKKAFWINIWRDLGCHDQPVWHNGFQRNSDSALVGVPFRTYWHLLVSPAIPE